jgi:hypothetical protein
MWQAPKGFFKPLAQISLVGVILKANRLGPDKQRSQQQGQLLGVAEIFPGPRVTFDDGQALDEDGCPEPVHIPLAESGEDIAKQPVTSVVAVEGPQPLLRTTVKVAQRDGGCNR